MHIRIRDAASPYSGANVTGVSGASEAPIVLEPDDGHTPILGGGVSVGMSSYWTIRGLTFDGSQLEANTSAINVDTDATVVEGVVIDGNTVLAWGGSPITDQADPGYSGGAINVASYKAAASAPAMIGPHIVGNRILSPRASGIRLYDVDDAVVEDNEVAGARCQWELGNEGSHSTGIRAHLGSGTVIRRNHVHDFAPECESGGTLRAMGIWLQGMRDGEVTANLVRGIVVEQSFGMGVDIINASDDALVHHNIVADVGECGLCLGAVAAGGGDRSHWIANTVIRAGDFGIHLRQGVEPEVRGNVFLDSGEAQIRMSNEVSDVAVDDNLYWGDEGAVGRIDDEDRVDLAAWTEACACDAASRFADPQLPDAPEDFTPARDGAAVDAGVDHELITFHNGAGIDLGALEAPVLGTARIDASRPDEVILVVESNGPAPLRFDPGCAGLAVAIDEQPAALAGCSMEGDGELRITLVEPAPAGAAVELRYDGGTISDGARIGGIVDAIVPALLIAVDNESTQSPPEADSSTGVASATGTAATGDGDAGMTGVAAGQAPADEGCGCRHSSRPPPLAWLAALLVRRRRRVAAVALGLAGAPGCFAQRTYPCDQSDQCRVGDVRGTCEEIGYCSYPDASCASRARFGSYAPDEVAGRCVDEDLAESTTIAMGSGSETTATTPTCGDGVVDPGELCDDGNPDDADGCSHDCQPSGVPVWSFTEPGAGAHGLAWTADTIVLAGFVVGEGSDRDMLISARDPGDGAELWRNVTDAGAGGDDVAWGVVAGPTEIVAVGSETMAPGGLRAVVIAVDAMGAPLWRHAFDSLGDDQWRAISRADDGSLWVVGMLAGVGTLSAYEGDGSVRWTRAFAGDTADVALGLDVDIAGSIASITGTVSSPEGTTDLLVLDYSSQGAVLDERTRDGGPDDAGLAVARFADADLLVAGTLAGAPYATRFGVDGAQRWESSAICDKAPGAVRGAAIDRAGHLVLVGWHETDAARSGWIAKLEPDATLRWCVDIDGVLEFEAVALADDDAIYAAGSTVDGLWLGRVRP